MKIIEDPSPFTNRADSSETEEENEDDGPFFLQMCMSPRLFREG